MHTLINEVTPGSSITELPLTQPSMLMILAEKMTDLGRQLWNNFKRPQSITKFAALCLMSAALACYMNIYPWLFQLGNHQQMILTHTTCGAMIAITGVTWLGLVIGRDTPHYLTLAHAVIGAILLLAVSGVCFAAYGRRSIAVISINAIPGYKNIDSHPLNEGTLFATAMMALFSAFAYIADLVVVVTILKV